MVSKEYKFIFIHADRTGGNSIQNILRDYSEDDVIPYTQHPQEPWLEKFEIKNGDNLTKHATLSAYNERWEKSGRVIQDYFKFGAIRNPWDRALSSYFFCRKTKTGTTMGTEEPFSKEQFCTGAGGWPKPLVDFY